MLVTTSSNPQLCELRGIVVCASEGLYKYLTAAPLLRFPNGHQDIMRVGVSLTVSPATTGQY